MIVIKPTRVLLTLSVQLPVGTSETLAKRIRRDTLAFQPTDGVRVDDVLTMSETGLRYAVIFEFPTLESFNDSHAATVEALESFTKETYGTFTQTA